MNPMVCYVGKESEDRMDLKSLTKDVLGSNVYIGKNAISWYRTTTAFIISLCGGEGVFWYFSCCFIKKTDPEYPSLVSSRGSSNLTL